MNCCILGRDEGVVVGSLVFSNASHNKCTAYNFVGSDSSDCSLIDHVGSLLISNREILEIDLAYVLYVDSDLVVTDDVVFKQSLNGLVLGACLQTRILPWSIILNVETISSIGVDQVVGTEPKRRTFWAYLPTVALVN